jgi:hypothetical protein
MPGLKRSKPLRRRQMVLHLQTKPARYRGGVTSHLQADGALPKHPPPLPPSYRGEGRGNPHVIAAYHSFSFIHPALLSSPLFALLCHSDARALHCAVCCAGVVCCDGMLRCMYVHIHTHTQSDRWAGGRSVDSAGGGAQSLLRRARVLHCGGVGYRLLAIGCGGATTVRT